MKRTMFVGATLAAMSIASAAQAVEHNVLILGDAYFPRITYMNPGDSIRFVNTTGSTHEIIAKNAQWTLEIGPESEEVIVVQQGVQRTFYDASSLKDDGTYAVEGNMSFAAPPVD